MIFAAFSTTAAKRAASAALILGSVAALPSVARADAPSPTGADALFREGRTLLDAKRYDEACPKLAQSQKLEPGAGTLVALALCHEGQGKTATAWTELNEAAALGKRVGRADLAGAAQKRAHAMEPKLGRVVVRMPPTENVEYEVKRDGEAVPAAEWGSPVPLDPGEHRVDVSAKGKTPRHYSVRLVGAGLVEVVVDKLEDAREAAPVGVAAVTKPQASPVKIQAPLTEPPAEEEGRGGGQRAVGLGLIGVGVIGLGAGAYFGGRAISERAEGRRSTANDANNSAKDSFKLSMISVSSGVGAIAIGTVLYVLAPRASSRAAAPAPRATARLVPEAGPTQVGMGVVGSF